MRLIAEVSLEEFEAIRRSGGLTGALDAVELRQDGGLFVEELEPLAVEPVGKAVLVRAGLPTEGGPWIRVWTRREKGDGDGGSDA